MAATATYVWLNLVSNLISKYRFSFARESIEFEAFSLSLSLSPLPLIVYVLAGRQSKSRKWHQILLFVTLLNVTESEQPLISRISSSVSFDSFLFFYSSVRDSTCQYEIKNTWYRAYFEIGLTSGNKSYAPASGIKPNRCTRIWSVTKDYARLSNLACLIYQREASKSRLCHGICYMQKDLRFVQYINIFLEWCIISFIYSQ